MTAGLARNTLAAELLQVLSDNSLDLYKVVDWIEVVEGPKGEMLGVLKLPANMKHTFNLQTLITEKLDYFSRTEDGVVTLEPLVLVQIREAADGDGNS